MISWYYLTVSTGVIIDDTPIRIGSCGAGDAGGEAAEEERTRKRKRALQASALIHRNPVDALMEFLSYYPPGNSVCHISLPASVPITGGVSFVARPARGPPPPTTPHLPPHTPPPRNGPRSSCPRPGIPVDRENRGPLSSRRAIRTPVRRHRREGHRGR